MANSLSTVVRPVQDRGWRVWLQKLLRVGERGESEYRASSRKCGPKTGNGAVPNLEGQQRTYENLRLTRTAGLPLE